MKSYGRTKSPDGTDVLRGLAAGLIGGLVASWTMNQFQSALDARFRARVAFRLRVNG